MDAKRILNEYKEGRISLEDAEQMLRLDYIQNIGNHTLFDLSRPDRKNVPEVVFGEGKSPAAVSEIASKVRSNLLLVSRASKEHYAAVCVKHPSAKYYDDAKMIIIGDFPEPIGLIGIVAAGTSDIPFAEESRIMAESMGVRSITAYDVGVSAIHRLLDPLADMLESKVDAIIVAAGMEGALATIVSSFSNVPVVGLPTPVGYGFGGKGEAAMVSMLQSCSPGLAVVNIGNGIGAGAFAAMISLTCRRTKNEL